MMKKIKLDPNKLAFNKESIRKLTPTQLEAVNGGTWVTYNCKSGNGSCYEQC